jgi:plastocyanin
MPDCRQGLIQIVGTQDMQFAPAKIRINVGDEVKFINVDGQNGGLAYWVLSVDSANGVPNGVFDSGLMEVGDTYTVKFNARGVYTFIDGIYPATEGYIVVE